MVIIFLISVHYQFILEDMFDEEEVEEKPQAKEIDTKMHSIQEMKEEDEDCEHIGRGMRTGLSIEGINKIFYSFD